MKYQQIPIYSEKKNRQHVSMCCCWKSQYEVEPQRRAYEH